MNPKPFTTEAEANVQFENDHLATTEEEAQRHTAENLRRVLEAAVREEFSVGLEDLDIDIVTDARRSER